MLLAYDPYARSIGLEAGSKGHKAAVSEWEYYLVLGDSAGARVIRKSLSTQRPFDQGLCVLEGSWFEQRRIAELMCDATELQGQALWTRGSSTVGAQGMRTTDPRFLEFHESSKCIPAPRAPTSWGSKVLRWFKKT